MSERTGAGSSESFGPLVQLLLSADRGGAEPTEDLRRRVADALGETIQTAHDAWPAVVLPSEAFVAFLAERLPAGGDLLDGLASLRTRELYLTCACSRGDRAALSAFDSTYVGPVGRALCRIGFAHAVSEDAVQAIRDRLLFGSEGKRPRIVGYAGRGDLARWVRASAVRAAIRLAEKRRDVLLVDDRVLEVLSGSTQDLELDFLKRAYGRAFESAAREAFTAMAPRDRNLLRYYFVKGLTIDELSVVYRIHRATAARQVKKANAELVEKTRQCLTVILGIPSSDVSSILRLLQSQIELALGGVFAERET